MTEPAVLAEQPAEPGNAFQDVKLRTLGKSVAGRLAREHPTLLLTLSYLGLTLVGLIYDLWFYAYFRINILDYSETSDFLLAAIRNPLVILLSMLPILILMSLRSAGDKAKSKSKWYERYATKYETTRWSRPMLRAIIYILFIGVYATVFTQIYAERVANHVKAGNGRRVTLVRNNGVTTGERPILLGSTTKFFFLYYPSRKETEIVPVENTALIKVDSRPRKEREADSLAALNAGGTKR